MQLLPFQETMVRAALAALAKADQEAHVARLLFHAMTGSGKTLMVLTTLERYAEKHGYRALPVLWTTMEKFLHQQAQAQHQQFFPQSRLRIHYQTIFSPLPAALAQTATPWLWVLDECHHEAAKTARCFTEHLPCRHRIGATASDVRSDQHILLYNTCIPGPSMAQLILEKRLSPYWHYQWSRPYHPEGVAQAWLTHAARWGQTLLFFQSQEQCQQAQHLLQAAGVAAQTCTPQNYRKTLADFASGDLRVVLSMRLLREGFDLPALQSVFIPPNSPLGAQQMGGRALRFDPATPIKHIVESEKNRGFYQLGGCRQRFIMDGATIRSYTTAASSALLDHPWWEGERG